MGNEEISKERTAEPVPNVGAVRRIPVVVYKDLGVATAKKCEQYEKLIKNGFFKPGVEMYTDFKSGILYLKYSQDLIRTQRW